MLEFFTDPVLRAPTLGTMLMCFGAGLIGCLAFLQKRSLVGEALSHAAYPGVVLSILVSSLLFPFSEKGAALSILIGALLTSSLGLIVIHQMEKRLKISSDAALCFVLSLFFGVGVLFASRLQIIQPLWFQQIQLFLFGQAATMVDGHIILYGALALFVVAAILFLFRYLEILYFDRGFAKALGMRVGPIDLLTYFLLVVAVIVGMRSVGVVLMSAMLIAPPAAARQWTNRFGPFLALSSFFGLLSGFLGNLLSIYVPRWVGEPHLSLATGPMIVLVASSLCVASLLFSTQRGYCTRMARIAAFRLETASENLLKALYKKREGKKSWWLLKWLEWKGLVENSALTDLGVQEAEKLIRLHRLWEVYLVHMGQGVERVHASAEEMEHILTPEIEQELQALLDYPTVDPHEQPIPGGAR